MLFNLASRATVETTLNGSVLFIHNVSISDAGVFTCLANNGIPRERPITIREKLFLLVNRKSCLSYTLFSCIYYCQIACAKTRLEKAKIIYRVENFLRFFPYFVSNVVNRSVLVCCR